MRSVTGWLLWTCVACGAAFLWLRWADVRTDALLAVGECVDAKAEDGRVLQPGTESAWRAYSSGCRDAVVNRNVR